MSLPFFARIVSKAILNKMSGSDIFCRKTGLGVDVRDVCT